MAITLAKGQGLTLEKSQNNLSLVTIGLGWDIAEQKKGLLGGLFGGQPAEYDLDVVAFLCDADGKVRDVVRDASGKPTLKNSDVIYFNNLKHRTGDIWLTGDNRTGAGDGDDDGCKRAGGCGDIPAARPDLSEQHALSGLARASGRFPDLAG